MFFSLFSCSFLKYPSSLKGVSYTSLTAPVRIFGSTPSISFPLWLIIWFSLCWVTSLISLLAFLIIPAQFSPHGWQCLYQHKRNHMCLKNHLFVFSFDIFDEVCFFFACVSCLMSMSAFVISTKIRAHSFFDLDFFCQRILTQSLCSPPQICSISSVLNFEVRYPWELLGKETTTSESCLS